MSEVIPGGAAPKTVTAITTLNADGTVPAAGAALSVEGTVSTGLDLSPLATAAKQDTLATKLTDGSLRGVTGPLVKAPLTVPTFTSVGSGSAASLGTTQPNNPDGKNQQAVLTAGAGPGCYAGFKDIVYGPVVGIRIPRTSGNAPRPPFDVEIDGVSYPVDHEATTRYDNVSQTVVDYESLVIIATGLEDKAHTVKVHVPCDVGDSPAARTLSVFGWVCAQGRGYHHPPQQRTGGMASSTPTTVPTSAAQISVAGLAVGLSLYNGDASSRTITITGPDGSTPWKKIVLAAGATWEYTLPSPRTLSGYKWSVDSTSNVKGWVEVI